MEKPKIVYFNFRSEENARCHYLHKNGNVLIAFYDSKIGVKIEINKLKIVVRIKTFFFGNFSDNEERKSKI